MKVQLNAQVPAKLAEKVRADARRNHKTLDDVVSSIIGDFYGAWTVVERAKFFTHAPDKKAGRKVAA
jgi:hypothetical protein